jgi:dTDP-4-dehydrorhamnose 3,5-epimerase
LLNWSIRGEKDPELIKPDWSPVDPPHLEGVVARQITNVLTRSGYLTEAWRRDWELDDLPVGQVFQRTLDPGEASGWHAHAVTTDRLFCAHGRIVLALYDGRIDSPTHCKAIDFRLGLERPAVIVVPPGVWHGVKNIGSTPALFLNIVDIAYDYEAPDHFRLPIDTPLIPYQL